MLLCHGHYYLFFFLFYLGNENWEKLMSGTSPSSYKRRRSSESEVIRHYQGRRTQGGLGGSDPP